MPATEIPPKRPLPPPPPQIDGSDLYDAERWEHVYREMHNVPELLIQLQDDLSRARKREAFWISVITHLVLAILVVNSSKLERYFPQSRVIIAKPNNERDLSYIVTPPDEQKITKKPDTNKISDRDHVATKRTTEIDREELKKILDSSRAGAPGMSTPPPQPQQQQQQQQAEAQPQAPPQQQPQAQVPQDNNPSALRAPQQAAPPKPSFGTGNLSAGSAIEQAARASIGRGPRYGSGGDNGLSRGRQATNAVSNLDVLSDTMGVDFGPYLQRVIRDVKANWENLIPESARPPLLKRGKLSIEFAIMKNGTVQGMTLASPSGDVSLDRAAWGGITNSAPFQALPGDFRGDYLLLRFNFYYNPEGSDLD